MSVKSMGTLKLTRISRACKYRKIAVLIHGKLHTYCKAGKAVKALRVMKKAKRLSTWVA